MGRGPSYPFIDLEEAIAATKKIYDYTKRAPAPTDSVVQNALGYSLKSSGGVKTIAALRSYGLIEESAQTLKISDSAYRILMDHPESPERKQAIKDAALSPKWYRTAFDKWGSDPPPSTRSTLILNHGFVPTTVDAFLKDYKKTIEYAGLTEMDGALANTSNNGSDEKSYSPKIGEYVQWELRGELKMPAAKRVTGFSPNGDFAFLEGSLGGVPTSELIPAEAPDEERAKPQNIFASPTMKQVAPGGAKMQTETFALPEGVTGQLQWPSTMSSEAYEDFVYQLEGLKRRVGRAVRKDNPNPPEVDITSNSEG